MIDLHSHTTASDGQYPPEVQVRMAAKAGVTVLAVTDHDTVGALEACEWEAQKLGMRLVSGIEISCTLHRREVHILGHFIDRTNPALKTYTVTLEAKRHQRMQHMVEKLQQLGVPVTMDHVQSLAGNAPLTRPHLARALVELGVCSSTKEAFARFLGDGRMGWVPRFEMDVASAIHLIHQAQGTATLAHPASSHVNRLELEGMAHAGLDGLEVVHRDHPPSQRELFTTWAREFNLCCTAGSDFHGELVAKDRHFGDVSMGERELTSLFARRTPS
jgi:predicted metal-dependent phosphoesterase TrpH